MVGNYEEMKDLLNKTLPTYPYNDRHIILNLTYYTLHRNTLQLIFLTFK